MAPKNTEAALAKEKTTKATVEAVTKGKGKDPVTLVKTLAAKPVKEPKVKTPKAEPAAVIDNDYQTIRVPLSSVQVDYGDNPRYGDKGTEAMHKNDPEMEDLIHYLTPGQFVPAEGYHPANDPANGVVLTEGFRRYTALSLMDEKGIDHPGKGTLLVHIIADPEGRSLIGRQLATNSVQVPYTLGNRLKIVARMLQTKTANGRPLKKEDIAKEFNMSPQAMNTMVQVVEDGSFMESVEVGALSLNAALKAVKGKQAYKDQMAEALAAAENAPEVFSKLGIEAPQEGETPEEITEKVKDRAAELMQQTLDKVKEQGRKLTADNIEEAIAQHPAVDNPIPATTVKEVTLPTPSTPGIKKGERVTPMFNEQLAELTEAIKAYTAVHETIPAPMLEYLMEVVVDGANPTTTTTMLEGWNAILQALA